MAVYLGASMPSFYLGNTPVQLYLGNTLVSGEYETITDSEEAYSKIVPAGGKYASIKAIGGKSVVWNQLIDQNGYPATETINGVTFTNNGDGSITVNGTATDDISFGDINYFVNLIPNHKYLKIGCPPGGSKTTYYLKDSHMGWEDTGNGYINSTKSSNMLTRTHIDIKSGTTVSNLVFKPRVIDLSQLFGFGNEPSTVDDIRIEWIYQYAYAHPDYNSGELLSAVVESIKYNDAIICEIPADVRSLFGYGWSAGAAYNSIERTESGWQYVQRVKKYTFTGNESWNRYGTTSAWISYDLSDAAFARGSTIISIDFNGCVSGSGTSYSNDGDCWLQATSAYKRLYVCNSAATTEQDMKQFTIGKTIYYPLATPITTDITSIMGDFKNRFAVGAGGRITFENAAKLSVPNTVEYTVQK